MKGYEYSYMDFNDYWWNSRSGVHIVSFGCNAGHFRLEDVSRHQIPNQFV